ncbi:MAG: peptidase S1 [Halanaerobiales bacterium]
MSLLSCTKRSKVKKAGILVLVTFSLMVISSSTVMAEEPDYMLEPEYGSVELDADFKNDPYTREIHVGGEVSIRDIGFIGYVAEAPDFDLYYEPGYDYPLIISVEPGYGLDGDDIVLLINAPDEEWYFAWESLGPEIKFENPESGLYNIWVGTISKNDYAEEATLYISEIE